MSLSPWRPRRRAPRTILPAILIPLLALVLIAGSLAVYFADFAHAAPLSTPVAIAGNVPALVAKSKIVGPASAQQQLSLSVELHLRNEAMLKNYVSVISHPKSAYYHHYLTQAQLQAVFSPASTTYTAVKQYLQQSGFTITRTYSHRLLIDFSGTVGLAEQVFHVQINKYVSASGESFYANATDPFLPSSLAATVQMVSGLSNAQRWQHPPLPVSPRRVNSKAMSSNGPALFCPGPVYQGSYFTPGQIQVGYNLSGLYSEGDHGEGQTVALFELDAFQMSDLTNYESCYDKQTHTHIYTIPIDGGPPSPGPGDQGPIEVELDAEQVLSAAPALGQLDIYEAPDSWQGYIDEWAQIIQNNPPIISTSWGECENDLGLSEAEVENNDFLFASAQGETVYAASGDTGSSGCIRNDGTTVLNAGDPASQPYVTGVGGSSLSLNGNDQYSGEVVWNDPPVQGFSGGASGGGISQFWTEDASWLNVPGVQNQYSTGATCNAPQGQICREEPDVSLNADPYVGYLVYCTVSQAGCSASEPWLIVGGTSAAAPLWAAMTALANEQSLKEGGFNMGWITPLLYDVASNSGQYANDFHDITSGNNDYNGYQGGLYPATPGYDLATGLGSFNAASLTTDLISYNGQRAPTPANTQWYFAEGAVGGDFA
ncbi:MAG TPA: S53 family peptidase, partial [Ktedonobacteraceae bacterium]|nr:S53 family peptidase [Ktedonobacteraceae bacterium]